MVEGRFLIAAACGLAVAATAAGALGRRAWVRGLLSAVVVLTVAAMGLLLAALLGHNFKLDYVVRHTSLALPPAYCVAALWAGQEGTILLWALLLELAAVGLLSRRRETLDPITVLLGVTAGFLLLICIRSPFAPVTEGIPQDGQGLNPLLRNPWMIIHPPVLFAGYALMTVPFALALSALYRRDPDAWAEAARPWTLAAWVLLGAGMMLGGYWAYITLGWGGFWAWDPVENSSLIPWLVATALLHGLLLQKRSHAFRIGNFVLAMLAFGTVIYGSYLTRSGALDKVSVHSFESLGRDYNALWLCLLIVPLVLGFGLLLTRLRELERAPVPGTLTWLLQATWLVSAMALFVLIGTSAPLVTGLFGNASSLDASFYDRTQTAFYLLGAVLLVFMLPPRGTLAGALTMGAALAGGVLVALTLPAELTALVRHGLVLAGGAAGAMAAVAAYRVLSSLPGRRWASVGAGLAHLGTALLVLGAILSGPGQRQQPLTLREGQPVKAPQVGTTVTYLRSEQTPDGKTALVLTADGRAAGRALMYETSNGLMRTPALVHQPGGDLYLEPEELTSGSQTLHLAKGQSGQAGGLTIRFDGFDMSSHMGGDAIQVGAKLAVDDGHGAKPLTPKYIVKADGADKPDEPFGPWKVRLVKLIPEEKAVDLEVVPPDVQGGGTAPQLVLRVTRKPLIGLVWLGTVILLLGGCVALGGRGTPAPPGGGARKEGPDEATRPSRRDGSSGDSGTPGRTGAGAGGR